jgi:DNA-directed RNA polymerase subunit RPC12/RpoP
MDLSCPKCSKQLPEVETLKYRFCPHCGAEIAAAPKKLEDAFLTIAPDLAPPQPKLKPPEIPPPSSFFRTPSEPIKPPPQDIHKQPPTKNRNKIIIAVLISLAVVILIIGGLFTF